MKPKSRPKSSQLDLFQAPFEPLLNHAHPLFVLVGRIAWDRFDAAFSDCDSSDLGAPAKSIRLLVGRHDRKHALNESDESLLERWVENPSWQYFCGFDTMQHELPLHPISLTKWRQRLGADKLAEMLQESIALDMREKLVTKQGLAQVNVDTTVQEKNMTHPTDSKLYHTAIIKLARAAKQRGGKLRQTYVRVAKQAAIAVSRYAHAKPFKRMRRKVPEPDSALETLLDRYERLHA